MKIPDSPSPSALTRSRVLPRGREPGRDTAGGVFFFMAFLLAGPAGAQQGAIDPEVLRGLKIDHKQTTEELKKEVLRSRETSRSVTDELDEVFRSRPFRWEAPREAVESIRGRQSKLSTGRNLRLKAILETTREELEQFRQEHRQSLQAARRTGRKSSAAAASETAAAATGTRSLTETARREGLKNLRAVRSDPPPALRFETGAFPTPILDRKKRDLALARLSGQAARAKENLPDEKPLSLAERQARAERHRRLSANPEDFARRNQLRALQVEFQHEPLRTYGNRIDQFDEDITHLKTELRRSKTNVQPVLFHLGQVYLESQRYLNAMEPRHRLKIIRYADLTQRALGSYDLALWALKLALRTRADGSTSALISEIYEELGRPTPALLYAKRAEILFSRGQKNDKLKKIRKKIQTLQPDSARNPQKETVVRF